MLLQYEYLRHTTVRYNCNSKIDLSYLLHSTGFVALL